MVKNNNFQNKIIGHDPNNYFEGFGFDNVIFNDTKLDKLN